ncbi:MAG: hypothetical protein GC181_12815 [Bacteroidetes bacterium]|nr:hypothetical protein [Bacteroidota bacterium]
MSKLIIITFSIFLCSWGIKLTAQNDNLGMKSILQMGFNVDQKVEYIATVYEQNLDTFPSFIRNLPSSYGHGPNLPFDKNLFGQNKWRIVIDTLKGDTNSMKVISDRCTSSFFETMGLVSYDNFCDNQLLNSEHFRISGGHAIFYDILIEPAFQYQPTSQCVNFTYHDFSYPPLGFDGLLNKFIFSDIDPSGVEISESCLSLCSMIESNQDSIVTFCGRYDFDIFGQMSKEPKYSDTTWLEFTYEANFKYSLSHRQTQEVLCTIYIQGVGLYAIRKKIEIIITKI